MSFASPAWLWLALLSLVILALHLWRRRIITVSSVFIWQRIAGEARSRPSWRRLKPSLLLLLQLLTVLLIALALARPSLGGASQAIDHWIIVMDASGSMMASDVTSSRFAAAQSYLVEQLKKTAIHPQRISLLTAEAVPEVIGTQLKTLEQVQAAAGRIAPTAGPADWQTLQHLLSGVVVTGEAGEAPSGTTRVTLLTDPSGRDAAEAAIVSALGNVNVETVVFDGDPSNVGLTQVGVQPLESGAWHLTGTLRRFAGTTATVVVNALFQPTGTDSPLSWKSANIELAEDGSASFEFELELPGPGVLELRLPDDDLALDNRAYYVLRDEPRQARILTIGSENPALERALRAVPEVELFRADVLPTSTAEYDLVILDQVTVDSLPDTATWWVNSPFPSLGSGEELPDAAPTGWRHDHPLAEAIDWSTLTVARARQFPRLSGAQVLLEATGKPLIQARTTDRGRQIIMAFALEDSNWSRQPSFPAFVANVVHWVVPDLGSQLEPICQAMAPCPLDARWLASGSRLLGPDGQEVDLTSPFSGMESSATAERWLPKDFEALFRPERPGIYTLIAGDRHQALAVNAFGTTESELTGEREGQIEGPNASAAVKQNVPLWAWVLISGLQILLLEGWLAGRGSERFLHRNELASGAVLRGKRWALLLLRLAVVILLGLAIANVPLPWLQRNRQLVLIMDDTSLYDAPDATALRDFTAAATQGGEEEGLIRLGAEPKVIAKPRLLMSESAEGAWPGADLESALTLAAGMLPAETEGRIVVAASGVETQGQLADVIPRLQARGIPVDVYPVGGIPSGEVFVERVEVPQPIYAAAPFLVTGLIYSAAEEEATVQILRDGEMWAEQKVRLSIGFNPVETTLQEDEAGSHLYEVSVQSDTDVFQQNNRNGVVAKISNEPQITLFTPQPSWGRVLADALALQGQAIEVLTPDLIPWRLEDWLKYDVVILMNVPALDLRSTQQEQLESWVRDYGGGLLLLGGENSFGPGGYYQTPLERLSPLSSKVPREAPEVALLFVLDRSGSMQQQVGGISRLDIAKKATLDAIDLINEQGQAGVVVFDTEASVLAPLQSVQNKGAIEEALRPLEPGGGTSLYPALVEAYSQLQGVESMSKHVVVMTDGLSQPGDFEGVLNQMRDADITISFVAIGEGADADRMRRLSRLGEGTFYATKDVQALPSILAQEALLLSNKLAREETIQPIWQDREPPFVTNLDDNLPPLKGYVLTTAKPQVTVELQGPEPDSAPLLASWHYGLGQVIAFASQGAGPWVADWLKRNDYPRLWAQAIRSALPTAPMPGLHLRLERQADEAHVVVDAVSAEGAPAMGLDLKATLTSPGGNEQFLTLQASTPGRYQAHFTIDQTGTYQVRVESAENSGNPYAETSGALHIAYPARYIFSLQGGDRLLSLSRATGGRVLLGDESLFTGPVPLRLTLLSVWPAWALAALILFLSDLLLRYLPLRLRTYRSATPLQRHPETKQTALE